MTGYGANSFTAFGLLFGLYGYLGQTSFVQFFGMVLAMLIVLLLVAGMAMAGSEIAAGLRRALERPRSFATVPSWYLTD